METVDRPMTPEEALKHADRAAKIRSKLPSMGRFNGDVAITLAAEVRRLRAAAEAVKNLPSPSPPFLSRSGDLIIRDDVLRILDKPDRDEPNERARDGLTFEYRELDQK